MSLLLRYAARSDRGLVRANNEDSVYAGARLLALADGMGGHAAGEVASQLVIAALAHLDDDEPGGDLLGKLDTAVRDGNAAIAGHVRAEPDLEGMGTTLTAILFAGSRLGLVHIGDSRGYLMRDGELTQITKDDTFVQTLVDEGRITAEEAHSHPQRSLIMRALTGHEVEPTLTVREARVGDRYLLCSDGLSDPVSHETIAEAMKIPDVAECADRLIELALRGGGPDNVTVVVADVVDYDYGQTQPILAGAVSGIDESSSPPPNTAAGRASAFNPRRNAAPKPVVAEAEPPPKKSRRRRWIFLAALLVLVVVAVVGVGRFVIRNYYYVAAYNDTVTIMRGLNQSFLGLPLQEPHLVGCLSARNDLSLLPVGQTGENCQPFKISDLRPSEKNQVLAGLEETNFETAHAQIEDLAKKALPLCRPPEQLQTATPVTPTPPTTTSALTRAPIPGDGNGPLPGPPPSETAAPTSGPEATEPSATQLDPDNTESSAPATTGPTTTTITPTTTSQAPPAPIPQEPGVDCREAA